MSNDERKDKHRRRDQVKIKIAGAWTASPNRLLKDRRLSRDARLLGAIMFLHAGNSGTAFPSQETLAEELSHIAEVIEHDEHGQQHTTFVERRISIRSVQRWLTELRRNGWLRWRQTMKHNEYTLIDPNEQSGGDDHEGQDRNGEDPDPSLNNDETGATEASPTTTEGSPSEATEGSSWASAESSSAIPLSCRLIPVSPSTMLESDSWDEDSLEEDSSSSDTKPTHRPDDDDDSTVAYLRSKGIIAAEEFKDLDPEAVRARVTFLERDPNLLPGGIVASLRNDPPRPAAPAAPHAANQRDPLLSEEEAIRCARAIAPEGATEEDIEILAGEIWAGSSDDQALEYLIMRRTRDAYLAGAGATA